LISGGGGWVVGGKVALGGPVVGVDGTVCRSAGGGVEGGRN